MTARTPWASVTATASERLVPAVAGALARLVDERAVAIPLLDEAARRPLLAAARDLPYRGAKALAGTPERPVRQDFFLATALPPASAFHRFAGELEGLLKDSAARLDSDPLGPELRLNDLVVQRYDAGSAGISPHRDHVRYRILVALVALSGTARFVLSADRAGRDPRAIAIAPGSLLLMTAPGFAGGGDRPFHALDRIDSERVSLGLRFDSGKT